MTDGDPRHRGVYDHWVTETLRFSDTDAIGHINHLAVAAYVEAGRVAHGIELVHDHLPDGTGFVLRHLAVDYHRELHYPGAVDVGTRVVGIGRSSFTVGSGVFVDHGCVATATSVLVLASDGDPVPIPADLRELLAERAYPPAADPAAPPSGVSDRSSDVP